MKQTNKPTLIAFCDYPTPASMTPKSWGSNGLDITLGLLDPQDGKPRNYSNRSTDPIHFGGFRFHIYPSDSSYRPSELSGWWTGPNLTCETSPEPYAVAARDMVRLQKRISSFYTARGPALDGVDELLRFLEAAGVSQILVRHEDSRESFLSHGLWNTVLPVSLAGSIRQAFTAATKPATQEQVA